MSLQVVVPESQAFPAGEKLGRGLIAVRAEGTDVFVSWRLLGEDPQGALFNVYRVSGENRIRLNGEPLAGGTYYVDTSASRAEDNVYCVTAVIDGVEQEAGAPFTLPAGSPAGQYLSIPLKNIGKYYVHFAWPGDLDGDGEYDFVVDRLPLTNAGRPHLEAYSRDGTFLWRVDMGPNSIKSLQAAATGRNPPPADIGGFANIAGHRDSDNVTVYDFDGDGIAEVAVRTAAGVVFGDGRMLEHADPAAQFISILDGRTGAERARLPLPTDYDIHGPMSGNMAPAYLGGTRTSLVYRAKNRTAKGAFNALLLAFDYDGKSLSERWKFRFEDLPAGGNFFHQIRTIDLDGDGRDEIADGGYAIDDDGTVLYDLGAGGVGHGDRFHIADMDPSRPGLEGFAVQQNNPSRLAAYYYDAATGEILRRHHAEGIVDVARGAVGDYDPESPGYEYWGSTGLGFYSAKTGALVSSNVPGVNFRIWWDGDVYGEHLDGVTVGKWHSQEKRMDVLFAGKGSVAGARNAPTLYGDLWGDWREEFVVEDETHTELRIYTTVIPTDVRMVTLPHNRAYRNGLVTKGYMQSHHVDYYLGGVSSSQ